MLISSSQLASETLFMPHSIFYSWRVYGTSQPMALSFCVWAHQRFMGYFPFPVVKHLVPNGCESFRGPHAMFGVHHLPLNPPARTWEQAAALSVRINNLLPTSQNRDCTHTVMWLMLAKLSNVKVNNCTLHLAVNWITGCCVSIIWRERESGFVFYTSLYIINHSSLKWKRHFFGITESLWSTCWTRHNILTNTFVYFDFDFIFKSVSNESPNLLAVQ